METSAALTMMIMKTTRRKGMMNLKMVREGGAASTSRQTH